MDKNKDSHPYLTYIPNRLWNIIVKTAKITGRSRKYILLELIESGIRYRLEKKKQRELGKEEDYF